MRTVPSDWQRSRCAAGSLKTFLNIVSGAGVLENVRVGIERDRIDVARDIGMLEQRLDLRGEQEPSADDRVVERLLAEPIRASSSSRRRASQSANANIPSSARDAVRCRTPRRRGR